MVPHLCIVVVVGCGKVFFCSGDGIVFNKNLHVRTTKSKVARLCSCAAKGDKKCQFAFCPGCYKLANSGTIDVHNKAPVVTLKTIEEAEAKDAEEKEVATTDEMAKKTTTNTPTSPGEAVDEKFTTPTKKRSMPQNCNSPDDAKTSCSKRYKMHQ